MFLPVSIAVAAVREIVVREEGKIIRGPSSDPDHHLAIDREMYILYISTERKSERERGLAEMAADRRFRRRLLRSLAGDA